MELYLASFNSKSIYHKYIEVYIAAHSLTDATKYIDIIIEHKQFKDIILSFNDIKKIGTNNLHDVNRHCNFFMN